MNNKSYKHYCFWLNRFLYSLFNKMQFSRTQIENTRTKTDRDSVSFFFFLIVSKSKNTRMIHVLRVVWTTSTYCKLIPTSTENKLRTPPLICIGSEARVTAHMSFIFLDAIAIAVIPSFRGGWKRVLKVAHDRSFEFVRDRICYWSLYHTNSKRRAVVTELHKTRYST